jgi:YfiH family protein
MMLRSAVLPFPHGFTTREGGVSEGPYAALNLGSKWGDDPARVRENRRRFFREAGIERLFSVTQVHGRDVTRIGPEADVEAISRVRADAMASQEPGVALGIYTADCIPLLLGDPKTGVFAAVHAGWRGTAAGIATAVVEALVEHYQVAAADLRVALGPSIGPCCFEVGEDVAAKFASNFVKPRQGRKPTVDLRAANVAQLVAAGVREAHIDASAPCTACDRERFYSFRRDGRETGQHVAYIRRP